MAQCFCYPTVDNCRACALAEDWVRREVLLLANELGDRVEIDDIENLYSEEDEDEIQEILQWLIVSPWLYDRLGEIGEPIATVYGVPLWGRTCCGQAIELDGTLQRIARGLLT